jgi:hypothetical protein
MEKAYSKNIFHHEKPFDLMKLAGVSLDCLMSDLKQNPKYLLFLAVFLAFANWAIRLIQTKEPPVS